MVHHLRWLRDNGIDTVLLAAPTTTRERMQFIAERTRGFLYYVSRTGVTSARAGLTEGIQEGVALAKEFTELPVCVGFGISKPEHGRAVGEFADGVVVGSAIVNQIAEHGAEADLPERVGAFVKTLVDTIREK